MLRKAKAKLLTGGQSVCTMRGRSSHSKSSLLCSVSSCGRSFADPLISGAFSERLNVASVRPANAAGNTRAAMTVVIMATHITFHTHSYSVTCSFSLFWPSAVLPALPGKLLSEVHGVQPKGCERHLRTQCQEALHTVDTYSNSGSMQLRRIQF